MQAWLLPVLHGQPHVCHQREPNGARCARGRPAPASKFVAHCHAEGKHQSLGNNLIVPTNNNAASYGV
jgi:hypothetical protein